MKKALILLAFILLSPALLAQHGHQPGTRTSGNFRADSLAVNTIIQQWRDNYNNGHAEKVAALYTEDATYLTQHFITGVVHGRRAIQAYVRLGVDAKYHIDSIRMKEFHVDRDFSYAITRYDALNNGVKTFGVNLVVLRKIHGRWMIVAHEAAVPDPGQAVRDLKLEPGK